MLIPKTVQSRILSALLAGKLPEGFTLEEIDRMYRAFDERWQEPLAALLDAVENEPAGPRRETFIANYVLSEMSSAERDKITEWAERDTQIHSLEEMEIPPIEWVWEYWIPRGMLTLLGAMPGAGKSYVALDVAARIIAGTSFPDGTQVGTRGAVIYVDAENVPQIHNQRASAWGMDRSQLFLLGPANNRLMVDFSDECDRDRLVDWAWRKRPVLIVIDSLSSISSKGENNVEDVRNIFQFLNRVALDFNCGMVMIHHLRKPGAQLPLPKFLTFNDLRGSSHIVAMSRSIIGLHWVQTGPGQDMNAPRRMEVLKTNLCRYPTGLGVNFVQMETDPDVAQMVYGEPPEEYEEPTKKVTCREWLVALLEEQGAMKPKDIRAMAEGAGYPHGTLQRARRALGDQIINTCRNAHDSRNMWTLAGAGEEGEGYEDREDEADET